MPEFHYSEPGFITVTHGLYRTHDLATGANTVRVKYDTLAEMDISEMRYRERRYQPDFDTLPWKKEKEVEVQS